MGLTAEHAQISSSLRKDQRRSRYAFTWRQRHMFVLKMVGNESDFLPAEADEFCHCPPWVQGAWQAVAEYQKPLFIWTGQEGFCQVHNHLSELLYSQKKTVGLGGCSDLCNKKQYLRAECFQGMHIYLETLQPFVGKFCLKTIWSPWISIIVIKNQYCIYTSVLALTFSELYMYI